MGTLRAASYRQPVIAAVGGVPQNAAVGMSSGVGDACLVVDATVVTIVFKHSI
jgi:hypothetical protein